MCGAQFTLIFGALISVAFAQFSAEPSCALPCITLAFSAAGCAQTDVGCACRTTVPALRTAFSNCLVAACNTSDLSSAYSANDALCSSYSASLTSITPETILITIPLPSSSTLSFPGASSTIASSSNSPSSSAISSLSTTPTPSISSTETRTSSSSLRSAPSGASIPMYGGLSTGAKAGMGIGVAVGALLFAGFGAFAFWYGKRIATRKKKDDEPAMTDKPALGPGSPRSKDLEDTGVPLNAVDKAESETRRRAAEFEDIPMSPFEVPTERAELEALSKSGNAPVEMD